MRYLSVALVCGIILLSLFVVLPSEVYCSQIRGNISTYLRSYESQGSTELQPYVNLRIGSSDLVRSGRRSIGFNLHGRWTDQRSVFSDDKYNVFSSYIQLSGLPAGSNMKIGRQFVFGAAGSANIDGIDIRLEPTRCWKINASVGTEVSHTEPNEIRSFFEAGVLTAGIATSAFKDLSLRADWYTSTSDGNSETSRIGADAEYRSGIVRLFGGLAYDLLRMNAAHSNFRLTMKSNKWYLSVRYRYRQPSVRYQSLFSLIASDPIHESRLEVRRTVFGRVSAYARYSRTIVGPDEISRYQIGLRSTRFTLGWMNQEGHRGMRNAFLGSVEIPLSRRLSASISADMSRYRVQDRQDELNDSYIGSAGIQWKPVNTLVIGGQAQYIRNAILADDLTLLFRISKSFTVGTRSRGE